jgi:Protein of unknown function (DUF1236)
MTNRLLISVATAALIAGTGLANAQGTGMGKESPSSGGGATMQHSAPSGGASSGAMDRDSGAGMKGAEHSTKGESSGMKASDSSDKTPGANKSAQDTAPGQKSKSMSSENDAAKGYNKEGNKEMKAEGRDKAGSTAAESRDKNGNMNAQTNTNTQTRSATDTNRSQTTTGNAATSATAAPPAEKRTQIASAIKSERVEDIGSNVNFNVAVGTTVPSTVHFHPLPSRIVEIYPEWRGYDFVLVHGKYVIVRPQTHEIVYIIEG